MQIRILVVDDEQDNCDYLKLLLNREGYEADTCTDPTKVVEILKSTDYHMVVLDMMMPAMSGTEVLEAIRKIDSVGISVLSKTEDIANARIEFENGCVANLSASRMSLKKNREIRVFQDNAYLSLDFMNQKGHLVKKPAGRAYVYRPTQTKGKTISHLVDDFVERVFDGAARPLVQSLIRDRKLGKRELEEIARLIEEAEEGR